MSHAEVVGGREFAGQARRHLRGDQHRLNLIDGEDLEAIPVGTDTAGLQLVVARNVDIDREDRYGWSPSTSSTVIVKP